jgi:hypothetical protein
MDFKKYEKQIKNLLVLPEKRKSATSSQMRNQYQKGVYVFSRDKDDEHHKIGNAHGYGGLFQRLKSYKICYPFPNEFFLQYLFICDSKNAEILEKIILARTDKLKHIEKAEDLGDEKDEGAHSLEWRFTAKKDILNTTIMEELNNNPTLWQFAVIFGEKGWKIKPSTNKITNFQKPAKLRDERPSFGEVAKVDNFIPGVLRAGDFGWVVYLGRTKKLVASKGKIVGETGGKWDMLWKTDKYQYPKNEVYATQALALKAGEKIIQS